MLSSSQGKIRLGALGPLRAVFFVGNWAREARHRPFGICPLAKWLLFCYWHTSNWHRDMTGCGILASLPLSPFLKNKKLWFWTCAAKKRLRSGAPVPAAPSSSLVLDAAVGHYVTVVTRGKKVYVVDPLASTAARQPDFFSRCFGCSSFTGFIVLSFQVLCSCWCFTESSECRRITGPIGCRCFTGFGWMSVFYRFYRNVGKKIKVLLIFFK